MVVMHALKEGCGDEEIAQQLVAHFDVALEEARRDCTDFRSQLKNFGLA